MYQRLSLTTKTALITFSTFVVVIWSLALFAGKLLREDTERLIGEQQSAALKLVADNVDRLLAERIKSLEIGAREFIAPKFGPRGESQKGLEQGVVLASLFNRGLWVTDRSGIAIASVPTEFNRTGIDYAEREYIQSAIKENRPAVGKLRIGRTTNSPVFAIAVPIRGGNGEVIGVLVGATDVTRANFLDAVAMNRVGRTGSYFLIDGSTNAILAGSDRARVMELVGKPDAGPEAAPFLTGADGTKRVTGADGIELLVSGRHLQNADWLMLASLPTDEMLAPIRETRWKLVNTALMLTAVAALLIWFLLKRQLNPAIQAAERIAALAEADGPTELLPVERDDEIGRLVQSFNTLLIKLKNREERLERTGEQAKVGGWEYYPQTEQRFWSRQLLRILEIDPSQVPATREDVWRFYESGVIDEMRQTQAASIEKGVPWELEVPMITGTGRRIWVRQKGSVEMRDGKAYRIVGTTQDITDRKLIEAELAREHEFAMQVINSMGQGLSVTDEEGRFAYVNPEYARMVGRPADSLVGLRPHDITPPDFLQTQDTQRDLRMQGETTTYESELLRPDGTITKVSITGAPRYLDGKYVGSIAVISDLTEQKRMETLLQEQRDFATQILNNMGQGLGVTNADGVFEYVNPAYAKLFWRSVEDLTGKNIDSILHPDDIGEVGRQLKLRQEGLVTTYQSRVIRKDGAVIPVLVTAAPRYKDGAFNGSVAVVTDLSERMSAERALRESEGRFRSLMENVESIAVQGYRLDGTVVFWNRASEQFYGYSEAEAIGKSLFDLLLPAEMHEGARAAIEQMAASGIAIPASELRLRRKDGSTISVYSSHAITTPEGRDPEFFCLDIDLTEREQAMAVREALEAKLRESQKMEAIGTLAGGIAHDFNNILATILGNVDLARQDDVTDVQAASYLEEIRKAGSRARDLVGQILSFSRRQPTSRKPLSLVPIIEEALRLIRAGLPANIAIEFIPPKKLPAVMGDGTQLQQVVMNLAANAIHAIGDEGGKIQISLSAVTSDLVLEDLPEELRERAASQTLSLVRLCVTDSGHGMDDATIARLFEPFFTTKEVDKGTGLGLSVVHGIVDRHDGSIKVESQPGRGATFTILFPAVEDADAENAAIDNAADAASVSVDTSNHVILYLDDDEALALLVTRMLGRRGYQVEAFTRQQDALDAVAARPNDFDLFVTDYNMPGMSGLDVARAVRKIRSDLPIAVASGFVDEKLRTMAETAGVREVIFKANVVEDFCEAVQRLTQPR